MRAAKMDFQSVDCNLRHCFAVLAAQRASGRIHAEAGVQVGSLGVGFHLFNAAFLDSPVEHEADLEKRIQFAAHQIGSGRLKWSFWLCESWLPPPVRRRAEKVFRRSGLTPISEMPGMVAEELSPARREMPAIEIRSVSDDRARAAFCEIGATCFNVPISWFSEVFDLDMSLRPEFAAYVGYVDGRPVTTAATVVSDDIAGIYNVGTMPGLRRRGYAEALVRFAIAQTGCRRTILQASLLGLPMYERMGYRAVCNFRVFTS